MERNRLKFLKQMVAGGAAGLLGGGFFADSAQASDELGGDLARLRAAPRISGAKQSYRWDSPTEYAAVMKYLDGGVRPNAITDIGIGLVLIEDVRRELLNG